MDTTLLIVGAGMSKPLGLPTTKDIYNALWQLLGADDPSGPITIQERVERIRKKGLNLDEYAENDFLHTMAILHDGNGARTWKEAEQCSVDHIESYCRLFKQHFTDLKMDRLRIRLKFLFQRYSLNDLRGLVYSFIENSPNRSPDIVDILTTILSAMDSNIAIPTHEEFPDEKLETQDIFYCDQHNLEMALNMYKLLFYKLFKHTLTTMDTSRITLYERFFKRISMEFSGLETLESSTAFQRKNYLSNIGYLTYNWDPVLPFLGMKANWDINKDLLLESGSGPCKKIYMDFGIPFAGIKLSGEHAETTIYSFGEDSAFLINAFTKDSYSERYSDVKSKILIKIMKLFIPHGLLNIRICPRCQNSFIIFAEDLRNFDFKDIARLLVSDPFPSEWDMKFVQGSGYKTVREKYLKGAPDELDCPTCEHPVNFYHSFMEVQSIVKPDKPSSVNKIHFDYGDFFSRASHIVSLGYSFPQDDILNSFYLRTMRIRKEKKEERLEAKMTFLGHSQNPSLRDKRWLKPIQVRNIASDDKEDNKDILKSIDVLEKLFDLNNIRMNFWGFPEVLERFDIEQILKFDSN